MHDQDDSVYRCPNGHGLDDTTNLSLCPECSARLVKHAAPARELVERANQLWEKALVARAEWNRWWKEHGARQDRLRAAEDRLVRVLDRRRDTSVGIISQIRGAIDDFHVAKKEYDALFDKDGEMTCKAGKAAEAERTWADARRAAVRALCQEAGLKEELPG